MLCFVWLSGIRKTFVSVLTFTNLWECFRHLTKRYLLIYPVFEIVNKLAGVAAIVRPQFCLFKIIIGGIYRPAPITAHTMVVLTLRSLLIRLPTGYFPLLTTIFGDPFA